MSSVINEWMGDIEKTSFDQVIFSGEEVFKKGIAWDGKSSWMKFTLKDDIFQWVFSEDNPTPFSPSFVVNENILWWNFIVRSDESYDILFFFGQWDGGNAEWIHRMSWQGGKTQLGAIEDPGDSGFLYESYKNSFPLRELPIYGYDGVDEVDGWSCVGYSDGEKHGDWEQEEGEVEEKEGEEQLEGEEEQEVEEGEEEEGEEEEGEGKRPDPFDLDYYSKREFENYYGSTLEWDFMSPEKNFKRSVIGKWILENGSYMRIESVNYLLDKMIETFM